MMDSHDGSGWGWGGWVAMSLMMLVFWGAVIWLVVVLVRNSRKPDAKSAAPSAEDVLAERFARSEIDEVEYQERLAVLRGKPDRRDRLDKTSSG